MTGDDRDLRDRDVPGEARRVPALWRRAAEGGFRGGARAFHWLYDRGLRRQSRLPVPVISIGNLTVGGTGKTPTVKALCDAAAGAGFLPSVLTRGYGGKDPVGVLLGGKQHRRWADPALLGDEPVLLSRALPRIPVVVGRDRFQAASQFLDSGAQVDVFLLDDGFQHRRLVRDVDIVLVDAKRPVANGRLLPAGPLREPPTGLARADRILVTGAGRGNPVPQETADLLERLAPGVPRQKVHTVLEGLRPVSAETTDAPTSLRGLRVHGVAGIARPERFRALLEAEGAIVEGWSVYRDHHRFRAAEVRAEEQRAIAARAVPITTAKDAVRLESLVDAGAGWVRTEIAVEVEGGWDGLFAAFLLR